MNYVTSVGVQQFSISLSAAQTSNTATITGVGAGAFILMGGINPSTANGPDNDFTRLTLTNSTTITANRNTAGGTVVVKGCIIDGDTINLIKSVQYGTVTIAATASSGTASISAVTNANTAVHLLGWTSANTTYSGIQENPVLSLSGTTVTAAIPNGAGGSGIVVGFCVIEFQAGCLNQSVQQLSATSSSSVTSYATAVTSVNVDNTICFYGGSNIATDTTNVAHIKQYGWLFAANSFSVIINTAAANAKTYNTSIVEFKAGVLNSVVQRSQTTLTGVTSNTSALSPGVSLSYSGLSWLGNVTSATTAVLQRAEGAAALTDGSTVTVTKNNATGNITGSWEVFEFPAYAAPVALTSVGIQKVAITIGSGATSATATITGVGSYAFIQYNGMKTAGLYGNKSECRVELTNSTTVTAYRDTSSTDACVVYATVVDAASTFVKSVQMGTITIGASSLTGTATISAVTNANTVYCYLGNTCQAPYSDNPHQYDTGYLSLSGTTLTATMNYADAGTGLVVGYCVIEFQPAALNSSTQQIVNSWTQATGVTTNAKTIASVTPANTLLFYGGESTNSYQNDYACQNAQLTNSTTVTIASAAVHNTFVNKYSFCVAEFVAGLFKSAVQRGTISLASTTSNTATISSITAANAMVNFLGLTSTDHGNPPTAVYNKAGLVLTNGTTVTANTGGSSYTLVVSYEVGEFYPTAASSGDYNPYISDWFY